MIYSGILVILVSDVLNERGVTLETHKFEGTTISSDSERTVSVSGSGSVSTDSERTPVRVDSQDSQVSDNEISTDINRWPRQNSVCIKFYRKFYLDKNIRCLMNKFYVSNLCSCRCESGTFHMMN